MVASCYFPDPQIPNPGAPNSADKTDDISRLFIYYVGRKKDQYLDGFHCGGGWAVSLVTISLWRISCLQGNQEDLHKALRNRCKMTVASCNRVSFQGPIVFTCEVVSS